MPEPQPIAEEHALLERATRGIRIVPCEVCRATGKVGLEPLQAACPRCGGSRVTTRLESTDDQA